MNELTKNIERKLNKFKVSVKRLFFSTRQQLRKAVIMDSAFFILLHKH